MNNSNSDKRNNENIKITTLGTETNKIKIYNSQNNETENIKTGEQFYVDLNTKDTNLKNITDNFFVFDGNNFFRIALWESRDAELINNLKSGTYTEPIVISKGE